jgi:drug/metabolite transporter (DMT)-like permease
VTRHQKWVLIAFLALVWGFSVIAPAFIPAYRPPPETSAVFPALVGAILAIPAKDTGHDEEARPPRTGNSGGGEGDGHELG